MQRFVLCAVAGLLTVATTGCWEKSASPKTSGPLLRMHFAGMDTVSKGTDATVLQKVWKMPVSAEMREQTLQKLARAPFEFWKTKLPAGTSDQAALIKPLLDDLVRNECLLEVDGPLENSQTTLAVRLSPERANEWDNTLAKIVGAWKLGEPARLTGAKGWEVTAAKAGGHLRFQRMGDWVLFGFGSAKLDLLTKWAGAAEKGRPAPALTKELLALDADLPHLRSWFPILAEYPFPALQLTLTGSGPNLKTELLLNYSEKIPFKFEPWKIPTELINDPLVSFTVAQGFAPLLKELKSVQALGLQPFPTQISMWGLAHQSCPVTFLAFPSANATNAVNQIAEKAPRLLEQLMPGHMGTIIWNSNKAALTWAEIPPFIVPKIVPYKGKDSQYVLSETFPRPSFTNAPPKELFAQFMNRPNLLYYDWEQSQDRMHQESLLYQLGDIFGNRRPPPPEALSQRWIAMVKTNVTECVTEITQSSPTQLRLLRKSDLGFTGFELVGLVRWMNSARFPFEYEQQPLVNKRRSATAGPGRTNAPPKTNAVRPRPPAAQGVQK